MRTARTCTYDPPDIKKATCVINYWRIDADTHVPSPSTVSNVCILRSNIVSTKLKAKLYKQLIDMSHQFFSVIDPYKAETLVRFTPSAFLNGLFSKADTLIDTAASLTSLTKYF